MIGPLRHRHRRMTTAVAVVVPIGLMAAIVARPVEPSADELRAQGALAADALTSSELPVEAEIARVFVRDFGPWGGLPLNAFLGRDDTGRPVIEFQPTAPLLGGDLLVYWREPGADPEQLTDRAVLLGRLTEVRRRFLLPASGGDLVLFDLALGQVIAARDVPALLE